MLYKVTDSSIVFAIHWGSYLSVGTKTLYFESFGIFLSLQMFKIALEEAKFKDFGWNLPSSQWQQQPSSSSDPWFSFVLNVLGTCIISLQQCFWWCSVAPFHLNEHLVYKNVLIDLSWTRFLCLVHPAYVTSYFFVFGWEPFRVLVPSIGRRHSKVFSDDFSTSKILLYSTVIITIR